MLKQWEILNFKHEGLILMVIGYLGAYYKLSFETILFSRVWNSRHGRWEAGSACWYRPVHSRQRGCLWLKCTVTTVSCRMIGHSYIASQMSCYSSEFLMFWEVKSRIFTDVELYPHILMPSIPRILERRIHIQLCIILCMLLYCHTF
jgi:hypothetical protein